MMAVPASSVATAFREHRRGLWGLAYQMTGSAADADDVVQETFVRAVEHPPTRADEPLRPWLVRIAVNVARDALRRRRRRAYVGPWLPSPVETADAADGSEAPGTEGVAPEPGADARYDLHESASFAFLLALEALTPQQRAVLLLRDVLDYSVRETAEALALSEGNVKTTHHRARHAMDAYDAARRPRTQALTDATRTVLERFVGALLTGDAAALEACLAGDVRLTSDGGGEFHAALRPVLGPDRVARFFLGLQKKVPAVGHFAVRELNGLPAVVAEYDAPTKGWGPRFVLRCDVSTAGAIGEVHIVVASAKLSAVGPVC
jgi:RNA polymerase sigma-70 factor, ECF subfamily